MNFLVDKEIDLSKEDQLNTKTYADTLKKIILSSPTDTCFTIGLFGEWGSGKSSIIKTVEQQFSETKENKTKFIIYDAWKYSNDSFRRMFLLRTQEELKFTKSDKFKSFYSNKTSDLTIERKVDHRYVLLIIIIFLAGLALTNLIKDSDGWKFSITLVVSTLSLLTAILGKAFNDHKVTIQEPLTFAPEQFEECFDEMATLALSPKSISSFIKKWISGIDHIIILPNFETKRLGC